ncbi:MAG TPA: hypothetical protein VLM41_03505 [Steroidobacteraceae bacterium]|nr:hypothetical protein [Steroidobacteraceae bacterium]
MSNVPGSSKPGGEERSRIEFWANILNKLAVPIMSVSATILGTWLTLTISERNNARAMINQREQAESNLRSNMFSQLVNPLIDQSRAAAADGAAGDAAAERARADRLTLLAELLALNFHEHFELGPLLRYVERLDQQSEQNRRTLRSVARRVTGRQIAMLGQSHDGGCPSEPDRGTFFEEIWLEAPVAEPPSGQRCFLYAAEEGADSTTPELACSAGQPDLSRTIKPLVAVSPDCRDRLVISLGDLDWTRETVGVEIFVQSRKQRGDSWESSPQESQMEFTLSPYSLPFSDNSLLRSGNRFGLYIRQVEQPKETCELPDCDPGQSEPRWMRLSFIWFPTDFFPPRERPTDFAAIQKALKLSRQ